MKSIKEKAEEYAKMKHTNKNLIDIVSLDFEAGANYVLEEFVDIVNKNTKPNGMENKKKMASDMLILIKQLKK